MPRHVRGVLFVDYVRMIRRLKGIDWNRHLELEDAPYLREPIEADGWYPMATFERFGLAIGREVAKGQLDAIRMWGRFQVDAVRSTHPGLVAEHDPRETLFRFQVLRKSFFDFDALDVEPAGTHARVDVAYQMSGEAEEQACHQTLGFFERLLEVAGAQGVDARLCEASWTGDPRTRIALHWRMA